MSTATLVICNKLGLHARAAAKFIHLSSQYRSNILVTKGTHQVNGKSIMGLMMLGATCGTEIMIEATGEDAETALKALSDLIQNRFGEGQ